MGACAAKYRTGARELGSSPGGDQGITESEKAKQKNTSGNTALGSIPISQLPHESRPEERCLGSTLPRRPQAQRHHVPPGAGLGVCGMPPPTVPGSQPYFALRICRGISGRFVRPKGKAWKLKVTERVPLQAQEALQPCQLCSCNRRGLSCAPFVARLPDSDPEVSLDPAASPTTMYTDIYLSRSVPIQGEEGGNWAAMHCWKLDVARCNSARTPVAHYAVQPLLAAPLNNCGCLRNERTWWLCVSSVSTGLPQANFEEKAVHVLGANSIGLEDIGVSVVCKKGYKLNCPNNDGFFVFHMGGCTICCVLDGHGPFGHDICNIVQQDLIRLTTSNPALSSHPRRILQEAILTAHKELTTTYGSVPVDIKLSGATVTIVVYLREQNKLVVAHVGNSRAVLCKVGKRGCGIRGVDLTVDHSPSSICELRRIVKAGGQVRVPDGDGFHRVFLKDDSLPGLALARSIGDTLAGNAGVIAMPDVREYKLDVKRDLFLLLCTDGVWNIMSSQEAVELAHSARREGWQTAPEVLARESWRRWINQEQIFADDITALFMEFP